MIVVKHYKLFLLAGLIWFVTYMLMIIKLYLS